MQLEDNPHMQNQSMLTTQCSIDYSYHQDSYNTKQANWIDYEQ